MNILTKLFDTITKEVRLVRCGCSLTVLHHDGEKAHYDFGAGPDENLALATFLCIVDAFQRIGEDIHAHHDACKTSHTKSMKHLERLNIFSCKNQEKFLRTSLAESQVQNSTQVNFNPRYQ